MRNYCEKLLIFIPRTRKCLLPTCWWRWECKLLKQEFFRFYVFPLQIFLFGESVNSWNKKTFHFYAFSKYFFSERVWTPETRTCFISMFSQNISSLRECKLLKQENFPFLCFSFSISDLIEMKRLSKYTFVNFLINFFRIFFEKSPHPHLLSLLGWEAALPCWWRSSP